MDLKTAFDQFKLKGPITAAEKSVDICIKCDGFGYTGHRMEKNGEPDYNNTITCPRCQGSGYMRFITYTQSCGEVFTIPEDEWEMINHE